MNILWPFSCEITVQNVSTINVETTNSGNTVNAFNNVTMGKSLHTKNVQFSLFELFYVIFYYQKYATGDRKTL